MGTTEDASSVNNNDTNNLRAIFEILAYLLEDAKRDGYEELADRLEFAMNFAERKLTGLKALQTVPPVSSSETDAV